VTAADEPVLLTCHCKRIRVTVPAMPLRVNECQCSICYRYGVLWAYYLRRQVLVESVDPSGYLQPYERTDAIGNGDLAFVHCSHCGCVTHWEGTADTPKRKGPEARMGVNWRMAPPSTMQGIERIVTYVLLLHHHLLLPFSPPLLIIIGLGVLENRRVHRLTAASRKLKDSEMGDATAEGVAAASGADSRMGKDASR